MGAESTGCEAPCDVRGKDWARGGKAFLIWCVPAAALLISALMGGPYLVVVWPSLLSFMGVACLLNARACGRMHCYVTGPFFLLLAIVAVLHGLGIVGLGSRGWLVLSAVFVMGGAALTWMPEWLFGRYRNRSDDGAATQSPRVRMTG